MDVRGDLTAACPWAMKLTNSLCSINNGYDTVTWETMVGIKQRILRIWDTAAPSVRIGCVKFAQRVVLAQSVAAGSEFRVRLDTVEVRGSN